MISSSAGSDKSSVCKTVLYTYIILITIYLHFYTLMFSGVMENNIGLKWVEPKPNKEESFHDMIFFEVFFDSFAKIKPFNI